MGRSKNIRDMIQVFINDNTGDIIKESLGMSNQATQGMSMYKNCEVYTGFICAVDEVDKQFEKMKKSMIRDSMREIKKHQKLIKKIEKMKME